MFPLKQPLLGVPVVDFSLLVRPISVTGSFLSC